MYDQILEILNNNSYPNEVLAQQLSIVCEYNTLLTAKEKLFIEASVKVDGNANARQIESVA